MEEKSRRKRVHIKPASKGDIVIDIEEYKENCSSSNAKHVGSHSEKIIINFWVDKHYSDRDQHGEDDGTKREDIGLLHIQPLIQKALPHLLYYSLKHKSFHFINHPPPGHRALRVVLKDQFNNETTLNIIAEYHFFDTNIYEVTVVTAMRKEDFTISVGQYELIFDKNQSTLNLKNGNNIMFIDQFEAS
ncbi:hypothetical protein SGQ83_03510 [Flavobacterium sp. Fl-318]|jgi:hypothetical protein|uniref:Uncharacterized protein n=1 Tax=Flavobacterium cupriresistens TaxID=2893885 RepID=A0ABU4R734_9FLAO|nr:MULTISPECIES: hypothetical protein [unclassified Flavobacterium]MDX6188405.1 hypothetical protein [Flavobacterium sp. Fl-318]UFH44924.1 hypothetical protein LNP23_12140 [Flavobacterium sp. F-323]